MCHQMGYSDDILVYSSSVESHKKDLRKVLKKVKQAGITLRGSKCRIGVKEVSYLGHVFSANGMSPDMEKIKIIQQWPQPTTISDVRRFHGLASYYRRYICGFSSIAEPLLRLMDKDAEFHWTPQCE